MHTKRNCPEEIPPCILFFLHWRGRNRPSKVVDGKGEAGKAHHEGPYYLPKFFWGQDKCLPINNCEGELINARTAISKNEMPNYTC